MLILDHAVLRVNRSVYTSVLPEKKFGFRPPASSDLKGPGAMEKDEGVEALGYAAYLWAHFVP